MLYKGLFSIHIVVSLLTLLSGFSVSIRSFTGWFAKKEYQKVDHSLSLIFTISLYAQLLLGSLIYILLRSSSEKPFFAVPPSDDQSSFRFWAIEHIAMMIFALLLTQLGRIYIKNSAVSVNRFKASAFYYGISLLLILISLSMAILLK